MSFDYNISLIDLSQQLPFQIDSEIKKEICFGETLIISCGHCQGFMEDETSASSWSCQESTELFVPEKEKNESIPFEIKDRQVVEEPVKEWNSEEEDDFHYFFFPDCNKTLPQQDSKTSLVFVDGFPKINPTAKLLKSCTCVKNKSGQCECFIKLPCKCGAKTEFECNCSKLENICICNKAEPRPVCSCTGNDACLCHPDGKIRVKCTCDLIEKPCICHKDKYPNPICICQPSPQNQNVSVMPVLDDADEYCEEMGEFQHFDEPLQFEQLPCHCQKPGLKPLCCCVNDCICNKNSCICEVQKPCVCDSGDREEQTINKNESDCNFHIPTECENDKAILSKCKCFVVKQCCCGNPDKCRCFTEGDCNSSSASKINKDKCICLENAKHSRGSLSKFDKNALKLKRMRSGKHGYRWCHEVDSRHTYFDYAFNRHDKISYKIQQQERFKILGLGDEKLEQEDTGSMHHETRPIYKKIQEKPTLDCCSSVGGISINVETLGEDKDKFLVQVVSHSSKEGAKTGSKLVSILDCHLHTMEENRSEYITNNDELKERRSYMTICDNGYYNKVTRVCGDRDVVKRIYHSFEEAQSFLLEGANIVLLRYFGLRRHKGTVKTETVLIDGTICESVYVCLGVSQAIVNGKPLFVVKVERHIIEPSGRLHQTLTVLTLRGYTVSHEWADSAYFLHINPLLRVVPEKDEIEAHPPLRERWREDLQLLSDFLDFKSSRSSEGARYMTENGTLTAAIKDYLQAILLLRPSDALHFTRHYFGATLSTMDLPHEEYFDPTTKHVRYYFLEE